MSTDVSRRAFFGAVASAAALPALAGAATPAVPAQASAGKTLKLGLASYSMRKFTLDQALEMARAVGIQYMTFKDVHIPRTDPPEATRALRAKIEAAGITIMGGGTITMENNPEQIRKDFVYAKDAGMPLIYASPDPAALDVIESMVKEHDVKLVIHNHGPEDKWWPAPRTRTTPSRPVTSGWASASTSATPSARAPIRYRPASTARIGSTTCTSRT